MITVSNDLTPREIAARRLLGLRALKTLIEAEETKARREAAAVFSRAGQREVAELPDGTSLGNVRADKGTAATWKVTDAGRFLAWIEVECPWAVAEKVVTTREVDPEYVKDAMSDALRIGGFVHPATGELMENPPPGVAFVPAGKPQIKVTGSPSAPEAVRALLGAQGAVLGLREVQA